jgi:hypothetical protein
MEKYPCPHCSNGSEYSERYKSLIKGPLVCKACDGTGEMPEVIVESLEKYCGQHEGVTMEWMIENLKNGIDHFYFWRHNMYHGVEFAGNNRGYIHT